MKPGKTKKIMINRFEQWKLQNDKKVNRVWCHPCLMVTKYWFEEVQYNSECICDSLLHGLLTENNAYAKLERKIKSIIIIIFYLNIFIDNHVK